MYDPTYLDDTIEKDNADEAAGCGWDDVMDIALACDTGGAQGLWSDDFCGSDCHALVAQFYAKCSADLDEGQAAILSTGIYGLSKCGASSTPSASNLQVPAVGSATQRQCALLSMSIVEDIGERS
eukprot:SAG31_NODE_53_length_30139_cov_31.002197_6_plen_125_part_00